MDFLVGGDTALPPDAVLDGFGPELVVMCLRLLTGFLGDMLTIPYICMADALGQPA